MICNGKRNYKLKEGGTYEITWWYTSQTRKEIKLQLLYSCDTTWKWQPSDNSGSHLHERLNKTVISFWKMVIHKCHGGTIQQATTCYKTLSDLLHNTRETSSLCNRGIMLSDSTL